jgi:hypothetical protein
MRHVVADLLRISDRIVAHIAGAVKRIVFIENILLQTDLTARRTGPGQ